jgi:hypothetical protein
MRLAIGGWQLAKDGRQKTEEGRQKTEDGRVKAEDERRKTEVRRVKQEASSQLPAASYKFFTIFEITSLNCSISAEEIAPISRDSHSFRTSSILLLIIFPFDVRHRVMALLSFESVLRSRYPFTTNLSTTRLMRDRDRPIFFASSGLLIPRQLLRAEKKSSSD